MARSTTSQARSTTKPERAGRAGSDRGDDLPAGPGSAQTRGRGGAQGDARQGGRAGRGQRPGAQGPGGGNGSQARSRREGAGLAATDWAAPDTTLFRDCIDACNRCLAYCLRQGGQHAEFEHVRSLMDCLEVCITTADLAGRNSPVAPALIQVCGEVAKDCEESCGEFEDDAEMVRCATACRDLSQWCLLQATAPQA